MFDTIALPRIGRADVNTELDQLIGETAWLTVDQLADLISVDQILGHPYSEEAPSASPVGRWVLAQLQAVGIDAVAYMWGRSLLVLDADRIVIGEVPISESHTLYLLDTEVNDLERPELTWQGEGDPR